VHARGEDLAALVTAVDFAMELVATSAFAQLFAGYAAPTRRLNKGETIEFIRKACASLFHICGTCRMGSDDGAVVDPELRVRGIDGRHRIGHQRRQRRRRQTAASPAWTWSTCPRTRMATATA